ncbi:MAG TPA: glutamate mutase L [Anaerolineales bacterium]|nr:glutamate mutase L [Anaerolineales bacterium]
MSTVLDADTLLTIDVGSVNTRAGLFDVVDGRYRLVATGRSPSTAGAPMSDVSEGVRMAIEQIQTVTGRRLVDESETLIMPASPMGAGVDVFVATTSAGPQARALLVGLMPGVSVESARRLADSCYLDVSGQLGLMDRRREDEKLDTIVQARPDLVLLVGGTDGGATQSVLRLVDLVGTGLGLLTEPVEPRIVYAGNQRLAAAVTERLGERWPLTVVPNIRPTIDREELAAARQQLAEVIHEVRSSRVSGFEELRQWSGGALMNSADAFGRIVRYLSQVYDPAKGVLGVDLGASHTTVAAGFYGDLRLFVRSDLGQGGSAPGVLRTASVADIQRWLPIEVNEARVRDYVFNKALHPGIVPAGVDELHIEYALAREVLQTTLTMARADWPRGRDIASSPLLPPMEPILASGGALARAPRPGYAALVLLDALQPTGVATLVLDPYNLAPGLGVAAGPIPMATVQALDSGSFVSLGTVVSPVGRGRPGRPVLRLRLEREQGETTEGEARLGQLMVLPLRQGEQGKLTLRPERGFDVGFGAPGKAGSLKVTGGAVGLIIDARGRPLQGPKDPGRSRDLNQKWLWDIGAIE